MKPKDTIMKKTWLYLSSITLILGLSACAKKPEATEQTTSPASNHEEVVKNETQTPKNIAWVGEYEGIFPCADCEGIKTELELKADQKYELSEEYLGKNTKTEIETHGQFRFDDKDPNIIILETPTKAEQRRFYLGDHFVEARDHETGAKIDSQLNYKLVKK
jgi:uncharacterized lipoprotein NlpE involved in copper resistance